MIATRQRKVSWIDNTPHVRVSGKLSPVQQLLLDGDTNTKMRNNSKTEFITAGLSLAPHKSAGIGNLCPHATDDCASAFPLRWFSPLQVSIERYLQRSMQPP